MNVLHELKVYNCRFRYRFSPLVLAPLLFTIVLSLSSCDREPPGPNASIAEYERYLKNNQWIHGSRNVIPLREKTDQISMTSDSSVQYEFSSKRFFRYFEVVPSDNIKAWDEEADLQRIKGVNAPIFLDTGSHKHINDGEKTIKLYGFYQGKVFTVTGRQEHDRYQNGNLIKIARQIALDAYRQLKQRD